MRFRALVPDSVFVLMWCVVQLLCLLVLVALASPAMAWSRKAHEDDGAVESMPLVSHPA